MIDNKQERHPGILLGIYGETDCRAEVEEYLRGHGRVKIMTTFDSLPKVCRILAELGREPYEGMQLVIDEWHLLLMSYGFRGDAIRGLLAEAARFRNVAYLSATPVDEEYWFPEMRGLRSWSIE